jgi:PleD family two-component response regulator
VLLPGSAGRDAVVIADALRARVAQVRREGCWVTASAGVVAVPADASEAGALIEAADGALAWAKRDGRDRTRRYDPAHVHSQSLVRQRAEILALLEHGDAACSSS